MKKETQPSQGNYGNSGGGIFASGRICRWLPQKASEHSPVPENNRGWMKKGLQSVEDCKKIAKRPRWSWARTPMGNVRYTEQIERNRQWQ
jgi:hypothetical protein